MTPLPSTQSPHRSHLFSVRLWLEVIDEHQVELRGQVQHVLSGETRYFRDWATLVALLGSMWAGQESDGFAQLLAPLSQQATRISIEANNTTTIP